MSKLARKLAAMVLLANVTFFIGAPLESGSAEQPAQRPPNGQDARPSAPGYCMDPDRSLPVSYVAPGELDLVHVLAPPPKPDSPQGKADLQAVLDAQRTRTRAQVDRARADACFSVFRFADAMGPGFQPAKLPFTVEFFQRVFSDDQRAIRAAKKSFNRPRPFAIERRLSPVVEQPNNASYPSGHATFAYGAAILLADIVPERARQIFDRAADYANGRLIGGVHYPSDLEAGRISASVIDNVLLHDPKALADLVRVRAEVRSALRLPPASAADTGTSNR